MADVAIAVGPRTAGAITRRRALPSSRAVVGALLVASSALGMFTAWSKATIGPSTMYAVATTDLSPGSRIDAADVRLATMELPPTHSGAFSSTSALVGATVLGPVKAGELVQAGAVAAADPLASPGTLEVSFAIEASRAVGGTLRPGEFVDVLATFGAGGDTYTTTVVEGATVLRISGDQTQTLSIAVASAESARSLTHAVNVGDVVVVRAAPPTDDASRTGTYRAPSS